MSCQPSDILDFAEKLSSSDNEVEWRSSVSRAYYAVYHKANEFKVICPEIHFDSVKGGSHKYLIKRYLDLSSPTLARQIGYILQNMCTQREAADYKLNDYITKVLAQTQIATAKRVMTMLDNLNSQETTEKQITKTNSN
jgi:uncharacterized protein (UPF0332 family)